MQTNNKSIIITLAAVLVAAFFMPWLKFFVSLSAWDMIFGQVGQYVDTSFKYLALLIPIAGAMIIYGAAFNDENYPITKGFLFRLPILTLIVITIAIAAKIGEGGGRVRSSGLENLTKVFGIGFWLTLIASIILPFFQSQVSTKKISLQPINYSGKSRAGIAIAIVGLILIVVSTQDQFFTKTSRYRVDPGAQGLPDAFNLMGPVYDTQTYIDTKKKNAFLYSGIAALLLGGLLFASGRNATTSNLTVTKSENASTETADENSISSRTAVAPNYTRPQVNINLPKVNWDATFEKTKNFLSKYKVILLSSAGVLIAFLVVYNLFIKDDPVKDGKNLAKNYCNCSEELNKNNLVSMQAYYDEFDNKKFKTKIEARNSLNNVMQENQTKYNSCTQAADVKYKERLVDYNSKGGQNIYTFEQTYSSIISACNSNNNSDIVSLQNKIDEKIKTIVDPEPDIEKIKADLIGQEIPGWKFSYLNEYKDAQILNITRSGDRIEYQVKFNLIDNNAKSEPECEAMVIYLQSEYGWSFSGVNMNYITYTNTFYPDQYVQITPLPNCTWNAENNYRISWKTSNWEYAGETITGPDQGAVTLPSSNTYFIKSLEDHEIKVKFTYRPAN